MIETTSAQLCLLDLGEFMFPFNSHPRSRPLSYEYLWEDGVKYKRPTKLPAPDYVDALMNWAQALLDDEAVFPNKLGAFHWLPFNER